MVKDVLRNTSCFDNISKIFEKFKEKTSSLKFYLIINSITDIFHSTYISNFIQSPSYMKLLFSSVLDCFFLAGRRFDRHIKVLQKCTSESSSSGLFNNLVTCSVWFTVFIIITSVVEISSLICFDLIPLDFRFELTFRFFYGSVTLWVTGTLPFCSLSTTSFSS